MGLGALGDGEDDGGEDAEGHRQAVVFVGAELGPVQRCRLDVQTVRLDDHEGAGLRQLGGEIAEALRRARRRELELRDLFFGLADLLLPEAMTTRLEQLVPLLESLDDALQQSDLTPAERAGTALPVRTPAGGERLRPVVRRLRLRAPGATPAAAREWLGQLRRAFIEQAYPVPATP